MKSKSTPINNSSATLLVLKKEKQKLFFSFGKIATHSLTRTRVCFPKQFLAIHHAIKLVKHLLQSILALFCTQYLPYSTVRYVHYVYYVISTVHVPQVKVNIPSYSTRILKIGTSILPFYLSKLKY